MGDDVIIGHKNMGMSRGTSLSYQGDSLSNSNGDKDKKNMTLTSMIANTAQAEIKSRMNKVNEAEILSKYINNTNVNTNINSSYTRDIGNK